MFSALQSDIGSRYLQAKLYFSGTCATGDTDITAVSMGLAFVQMYGPYEVTVRGIVRAGLAALEGHSAEVRSVRWELLPLVLMNETDSVVKAGRKAKWEKRRQLFEKARAADLFSADDIVFPNDGTHYRMPQLYTIWSVFGITANVIPSVRVSQLIGEVVENRNKIAHGDSTPEEVGRRYTPGEIDGKIDSMRDICMYLISTMESHCESVANLCR